MDFCCWSEDDKIVGNVIIEVILVGCDSGRDWGLRLADLGCEMFDFEFRI
jgi:hypothetical protein